MTPDEMYTWYFCALEDRNWPEVERLHGIMTASESEPLTDAVLRAQADYRDQRMPNLRRQIGNLAAGSHPKALGMALLLERVFYGDPPGCEEDL